MTTFTMTAILRRLVKRALGPGGAATLEQHSSKHDGGRGCRLERASSDETARDFTQYAFRCGVTSTAVEIVCSRRPLEEADHVRGPLDADTG